MYHAKAGVYFALSLLICWVARASEDDAYPLWLVGLIAIGATGLALQSIRQLRLHRYYEGRRTRLVLQTGAARARRQ